MYGMKRCSGTAKDDDGSGRTRTAGEDNEEVNLTRSDEEKKRGRWKRRMFRTELVKQYGSVWRWCKEGRYTGVGMEVGQWYESTVYGYNVQQLM